MKKNILFVLPTFEIGGTVISTKNLILLLDKDKYNVTVFSMTGIGSMKGMYSNIQQIKTTFILSSLSYKSWKEIKNIPLRLLCGLLRKASKYKIIRRLILESQSQKTIKSDYDCVVACEEGLCTEFVSYANTRKKIAWVRCDYSRYIRGKNKSIEETIYSKYDNIVCVSHITRERFVDEFPIFSLKTIAINNPQCEDYIIEQSFINDNDSRFENKSFTIVSVGRYDPIKRFTQIPQIASFLRSKNIEFKWYIIGDGSENERRNIFQNIISEKVEQYVICLGVKTNPHYYIRNSDLLVCLSKSEACPRVINEAKILHTPVVCTNFETAYEYLTDGVNGIISSIETIQNDILEMITNVEKYDSIKETISDFKFDNEYLLAQIRKIIDN